MREGLLGAAGGAAIGGAAPRLSQAQGPPASSPCAVQALLCSRAREPGPGLLPQLGTGALGPQVSKRAFLTTRSCSPMCPVMAPPCPAPGSHSQCPSTCGLGGMAIAATEVLPEWDRVFSCQVLTQSRDSWPLSLPLPRAPLLYPLLSQGSTGLLERWRLGLRV